MLPAEYYSIAWKGASIPSVTDDEPKEVYYAMHRDGGTPHEVTKELCDEINERNALLTEIAHIEKHNLLNFPRRDLK